MTKYILPLFIVTILWACSTETDSNKISGVVPALDSIPQSEPTLESAIKSDTVVGDIKDVKENHEKIVKKFGEQWDFCTCVIANDSINDAFEKGGMTPKQEEKLMARWEYVDNKCKELTTTPNTTPEERAKHDKKVLICLKQNGLRK